MSIEIERKFLVKNDQWQQQVVSRSHLKQGYLANQENATVRIRINDSKAYLTIKSATRGISRSEYEYPIPREHAEAMLAQLVTTPFIDKVRYKVKCGDHIWDLDVFAGENQGLIVAEVELRHETEEFERPEWIGEEVSDDPRYYNANLISHPYSQW